MAMHAKAEPRHDHAPDTDDVWAWIIIGLLAGAAALAVWLPPLAALRA
jgi:hypothetical protein